MVVARSWPKKKFCLLNAEKCIFQDIQNLESSGKPTHHLNKIWKLESVQGINSYKVLEWKSEFELLSLTKLWRLKTFEVTKTLRCKVLNVFCLLYSHGKFAPELPFHIDYTTSISLFGPLESEQHKIRSRTNLIFITLT